MSTTKKTQPKKKDEPTEVQPYPESDHGTQNLPDAPDKPKHEVEDDAPER